MTSTIERKYALTKVAPGDYLLPSNDAGTLWRLSRYKDGPTYGLVVDWLRDRDFWGLWRYTYSLHALEPVDPDDWSVWECVGDGYETRAEAIREALRERRDV